MDKNIEDVTEEELNEIEVEGDRAEFCDDCGAALYSHRVMFIYDDTLYEVCSSECKQNLLSLID